MNAAEVKEILTIDDIIDLLHELNADPIKKGNEVHCITICHNGSRRKLIYFSDSKTFSCFTDSCGMGFDIFVLVGRVFGMDFPSAFNYVCNKFNINSSTSNFLITDHLDTSFIKKFKKKEPQYILEEIPKTLLNRFYNLYHRSWIEDGISIETMRKFNIMFSIKDNKIIIPHFDIDGRLLGIRGRALNQEEIDDGKKYMPIYHPKKGVLKHPTGGNLYGVHINKEKIIKTKSVIILESEKGPQQLDTMNYPIPGVGISGSSITDEQIKILVSLGVENIILGLDKEFEENGTQEELFYKKKIVSGFIDKLLPYFRVSIIWDTEGLLDYKDAPTDKGKEIFEELMKNRIFI